MSAVVVLPLVASGGALALVLAFGQHPEPPAGSGESGVTGRQTLVSAWTSVPPVPLPQAGLTVRPDEADEPRDGERSERKDVQRNGRSTPTTSPGKSPGSVSAPPGTSRAGAPRTGAPPQRPSSPSSPGKSTATPPVNTPPATTTPGTSTVPPVTTTPAAPTTDPGLGQPTTATAPTTVEGPTTTPGAAPTG